MAEGEDGQEKTEDPTPKKRDDAKKEGQVITSREMYVFGALALATLVFAVGKGFLPLVVGRWGEFLIFDSADRLDTLVLTRLGDANMIVLAAGLIFGIPFLAVPLLLQAAIGGIPFTSKSMAPKANRIDPLKGLKRMVSAKSLVELSKAILKVTLLLAAAVAAIWDLLPAMSQLSDRSPGDGLAVFGRALVRVLAATTVVLAGIGAIDMAWQIYSHTKNLRMSRQEIKQETKEAEGSPEIKGRQRRLQQEASQRASERASVADVGKATAIVTNPTHFAVALRYIPSVDDAPVVLAKGRGPVAEEIKRRGRRAGVTIIGAPPLARALYWTGRIGDDIPVALYTAVATILTHVRFLETGQAQEGDVPDIDLPPELRLDEHGRQQRP